VENFPGHDDLLDDLERNHSTAISAKRLTRPRM
jgi:hypothetical protein